MSRRYIILVGSKYCAEQRTLCAPLYSTLSSLDLEQRYSCGNISLHVSVDTPTIVIPGVGAIVGEIFTRHGEPITQYSKIVGRSDGADLERHLIDNFWGEYILVCSPQSFAGVAMIYRDSSGGLPCVFSIEDGAGFATSNVSIAEDLGIFERAIDWDHIARFLAFPHLHSSRTCLSHASELLPGCSLTAAPSSTVIERKWSPWKPVSLRDRRPEAHALAVQVRTAIDMVVKSLAEKDEEIALELSGGLDSSIVAASLQRTSARVTCCTLMAPVPGTDERQYSVQMANQLGLSLEAVNIEFEDALIEFATPRDAVVPGMGILHRAVDEAMSRAAEKHGTRSFFSGSGGDAIFCYLKGASPAADAFSARGLAAGIESIGDLSTLHRCSYLKAARLTARKLWRGPVSPWKADTSFIRDDWRHLTCVHPWFDAPPDALPGDTEWIHSLVGSQSYRDGVDKKGRHHIRYPLLSQPVLEACLMVPTWMWIAGGVDRAVARAAFASRLPPDILHRRSKGSYLNYAGALYAARKAAILEFLSTGILSARGILDVDSIAQFVRSDQSHQNLSFMRLFDLCMVENWVRNQT